ncbi:meiosis-specific coiled-coil domain-containing protein MEIOC [Caerostris darwini]|uniref:Meiosis-specific coiled-coil domain-containing protein MEIOC n=1 Tax=Caerostris darwini TaxID=1538125 RepID=A0AAV4RI12_9ARAC|nr:meiosis-specific coiled-coil domain-containing protein MEIOC [Caerostris darwini]
MALSPSVTGQNYNHYCEERCDFDEKRPEISAAVFQRASAIYHCNTNNCILPSGVPNIFHSTESPHKIKISKNNAEISGSSHYIYENNSVSDEECGSCHIHNNHVSNTLSDNHQIHPNTKYLNNSDYGNCDTNINASWTHSSFTQRLSPTFYDQTISNNCKNNNMALQAPYNMNEGFSVPHVGNDGCGLDDIEPNIIDENLNTALLQEHAELLGLNLNGGMFTTSNNCSNLTSPANNVWPHNCNNDKKTSQEFITNCNTTCDDNMGYSENTSQPQHIGQNFFNSSFDQENGDTLSLNCPAKIFQIPPHAREMFTPNDGNNCTYEEWEAFNALQKSQSQLNEMFPESEFRFPDMDSNSICEPIDQQCFWTQEFGKQVSDALNMATNAGSWSPHSVSLSYPQQTSIQTNSSVPNQGHYTELSRKQPHHVSLFLSCVALINVFYNQRRSYVFSVTTSGVRDRTLYSALRSETEVSKCTYWKSR